MAELVNLEEERKKRTAAAEKKKAEEWLMQFFGADDSLFMIPRVEDSNTTAAPKK